MKYKFCLFLGVALVLNATARSQQGASYYDPQIGTPIVENSSVLLPGPGSPRGGAESFSPTPTNTPQDTLRRVLPTPVHPEAMAPVEYVPVTPRPQTARVHLEQRTASPSVAQRPAATPAGSATRAPFSETRISSLNIKGMTLHEFSRLLSQGAGWKVVVSREAGDIEFRAYFEDISGEDAIRAICQANNLWYHRDESSGIISIMTVEEYRRGILSHSQDTVKVVTLLYPDARAVGDALQRLFKNRVVWTPPDDYLDDPIDDIERAFERMESLNDQVQDLQQSLGNSRRSSSSSSSSSSSRSSSRRSQRNLDPLAENRVVEDIEQEVPDEKLVAQLAGVAEPAGGILGDPGIVYISAFRGTNDLLLRSSDPKAVEEVLKVIAQLDKPKPQVLLEVKVLDLTLSDDESYGFDWLFKGGNASGGRSTGINGDTIGTEFGAITEPAANLTPTGSGLDPKAMVLQVVTDDIAARIQAMQDSGRMVALATPNLCVADGEASRIFVGTETTILTSVSVSRSTYSGTTTTSDTVYSPETERLNVGTTLLITPRIHADRTTTIRIAQEDSQVGGSQTINYGENESFTSRDIETRTVTTTVVASDGQISAIGGLIREVANDREVGVPGLMKIPHLGCLFKTTLKNRERHELLVLIRPHVLLAPGEAEPASMEMLERLSAHPSAHGEIPSMRIGEGITIVNERVYDIPKQAYKAVKHQAQPRSTTGGEK
ncbi:MAG: hypothetical protein Q4D38_04860 [Planctomycetia bacterium]|nr:hypothetical protein [Planctomycetia bacterium]